MSLMMTVSQMTREGHHGQVGGRAPATLAMNRGLFLGAPRPVEGHRRQWLRDCHNFKMQEDTRGFVVALFMCLDRCTHNAPSWPIVT